jgi:hypothetical protein
MPEEKIGPETVIAMALLKAHREGKSIDAEGISGLFVYNPAIESLTKGSSVALRRVPSGGKPGRGIYSEDVAEFVNRFCISGFASREGDYYSVKLTLDGRRVCLLILWDEARENCAGLEILAAAMDFKISDLLNCFEPNYNYHFRWLSSPPK